MTSGIYQIFNLTNHKRYIGSTSNLTKREKEHFYELKNNRHFNKHLQRAYNKYGADYFKFITLEYCPENQLLEREIYWIKLTIPEYNNIIQDIKRGAGYYHSEEIREKMKTLLRKKWDNFTEEERKNEVERLRKLRKGIKRSHSEDTKLRIGEKTTETWKKMSPEKKQEIIQKIAKKKSKAVSQFDINGNLLNTYPSLKEAAKALGKYNSHIQKVCAGKRSTAYGYIWKYKID